MRKLLTIAIVFLGMALAGASAAEAHGPRFFIGVGVPGFYGGYGYGGYGGYGYPYGYGYRGYYGYPGYYPPPYPGYGYYPPPPVVIQSPPVVVQAPPVAVQAPPALQAPPAAVMSQARAANFAPAPAPAPLNAAPALAPQQYYYNPQSSGYYYPY